MTDGRTGGNNRNFDFTLSYLIDKLDEDPRSFPELASGLDDPQGELSALVGLVAQIRALPQPQPDSAWAVRTKERLMNAPLQKADKRKGLQFLPAMMLPARYYLPKLPVAGVHTLAYKAAVALTVAATAVSGFSVAQGLPVPAYRWAAGPTQVQLPADETARADVARTTEVVSQLASRGANGTPISADEAARAAAALAAAQRAVSGLSSDDQPGMEAVLAELTDIDLLLDGVVDAVGPDGIDVSGHHIAISDPSSLTPVAVGESVQLRVKVGLNGQLAALTFSPASQTPAQQNAAGRPNAPSGPSQFSGQQGQNPQSGQSSGSAPALPGAGSQGSPSGPSTNLATGPSNVSPTSPATLPTSPTSSTSSTSLSTSNTASFSTVATNPDNGADSALTEPSSTTSVTSTSSTVALAPAGPTAPSVSSGGDSQLAATSSAALANASTAAAPPSAGAQQVTANSGPALPAFFSDRARDGRDGRAAAASTSGAGPTIGGQSSAPSVPPASTAASPQASAASNSAPPSTAAPARTAAAPAPAAAQNAPAPAKAAPAPAAPAPAALAATTSRASNQAHGEDRGRHGNGGYRGRD